LNQFKINSDSGTNKIVKRERSKDWRELFSGGNSNFDW
jgi:hypothetical protein